MIRNVALALLVGCLLVPVPGTARADDGSPQERPDLESLCRKVWTIDYPDGRELTACKLRESTEIQGCWCRTGDTRFDKDWNLVACTIDRDYTFGDVTIPAPAWTHFYPGGAPQSFMLPGHREFQDLLLKSGKHDWTQHLYENGFLRQAYLAEPQEIHGVLCARATILGTLGGRTWVKFHDNGMLRSCKLAEGTTIGIHSFEKGVRIQFDRDGSVLPAPEP